MHLSLFPMLHPASNRTASTESFVSLQGGGRRRCGGIVDWRQRGNDANSECLVYEELKNGVLV